MKCLLKIKTNPISTNSAYFSRNKSFNEKSRAWRGNFLSQLQSDYNKAQIEKLRSFDPKLHMLKVVFTWFQPIDTILTKSGTLSLRSMDVDNLLKIPTDCIFDSKYNTKWLGLRKSRELKYYTCDTLFNVNINDKFIYSTTSIKAPSDDGDFHCHCLITIEALYPPQ